jgi:hypothetical protein
MRQLVISAVAVALFFSVPVRAQNSAINDIKGKIFDAEMAQKTFANGLKFCGELNGTNFFFQPRGRVLNLEDYHRSLENLARQGVFNPETKQPWNEHDAESRWTQVKRQAVLDQSNCTLVASLPGLQKKLEELQSAQSNDKP